MKSYLIADDNAKNYYIARRTKQEVKSEFHNMKIGEIRNLTETIHIIREK